MKPMPKWLLIPPAVALLLVLGPLSMQSGEGRGADRPAAPAAAAAAEPAPTPAPAGPAARPARPAPTPPRTPDLGQVGSALAGVLLVGGIAVAVLRRLRQGAPRSGGGSLVGLRQTLRLSPRHAVHALEFDDRIVLVGETDKGLALLDTGRLPEKVADEAEVLARAALPAAADDDGAVPRNLVIPRPEAAPAPRLPKPPVSRPAPPPAARKEQPAGLGDFRALLQKVGRA